MGLSFHNMSNDIGSPSNTAPFADCRLVAFVTCTRAVPSCNSLSDASSPCQRVAARQRSPTCISLRTVQTRLLAVRMREIQGWGIVRVSPMRMKSALVIRGLAAKIASFVVLNFAARPLIVSPDLMM